MQSKIKRSGAGGNPTHGHRKNNQLNYTTKMWRGQGVSEKMKLKDAISVMEEKKPVVHVKGRDITEYKNINSITIKMEFGMVKVVAELQDKRRDNVTFTGYIDKIYEKGE